MTRLWVRAAARCEILRPRRAGAPVRPLSFTVRRTSMGASSSSSGFLRRTAMGLVAGVGCFLIFLALVDIYAVSQPPPTNPHAPTIPQALALAGLGTIMIVAPLVLPSYWRRRRRPR